jgi:hypothetical protein
MTSRSLTYRVRVCRIGCQLLPDGRGKAGAVPAALAQQQMAPRHRLDAPIERLDELVDDRLPWREAPGRIELGS